MFTVSFLQRSATIPPYCVIRGPSYHKIRSSQLNGAPLATVEKKHFFAFLCCRDKGPKGLKFLLEIRISIRGIRIFFDRSESLKELWQFAVRTFSLGIKLESKLYQNTPDLRTCFTWMPTLGAVVALKRPIFKRRRGSRTLV
jgi:hypothetical protein